MSQCKVIAVANWIVNPFDLNLYNLLHPIHYVIIDGYGGDGNTKVLVSKISIVDKYNLLSFYVKSVKQ